MQFPKGKEIKLMVGGTPVVNVPLILEEPLTLNLSSTFAPLMGAEGTDWVTVLGGISKDLFGVGFSTQFKFQGFQIWKSTEPLSLNLNLNFRFGFADYYDAEIEVYNPMIKLAGLPLPTVNRIGEGVVAEAISQVLIPPGPSIISALFPDLETSRGKVISIEIGNLIRIPNIIVEKAEPTFADEFDDRGFPMWGKINLDIKSINIATVEMLHPGKRKGEIPEVVGGEEAITV